MNAERTPAWLSQLTLSAFVGFIMLFSVLMAGYTFVEAGQEKWGDPAWTGSSAGVAIEGFLQGADAKSIESSANPYPEVFPLTRTINQGVFSRHTRIFSGLTVGGELLLPIAILALVLVRFRRSRALLVGLAMLAASLNFLHLTEGDSRSNPPMVFMWLAVIWIAALWPTAALFYAVDLGALDDHPSAQGSVSAEPSAGSWAFFVTVLLIVVAGSLQMYWGQLGTFAALAVATFTLTAMLLLIERRAVAAPCREVTRPMTVGPSQS
jgi:thiosulfate dehydrogenase [quinone] large subunit